MKIGIDLSALQGPHRMRGIGYTLINFINNIPEKEKLNNDFVFYILSSDSVKDNPIELLDLKDIKFETRLYNPKPPIQKKLPGKFNLIISSYNSLVSLKQLRFGDPSIKNTRDLDVFIQIDPNQKLPKGRRIKKVLFLYDLIPYVLEWDYLWSYKTARKTYGFSRKAALRCEVRRILYAKKIKINTKRSDISIAISEVTKQDFQNIVKVPDNKIRVVPLGVSLPKNNSKPIKLSHYKNTSWGYIKQPLSLDKDTPFLLFVGGADRRRKLADLVTAFNHLRAQGYKLKLVLAGDSMQGYNNIATEEIQYALKKSSYLNDIVFMGFVNDNERDWLYKNALAFIFPSVYEGFGLPVLEAMIHSCPVISYRNTATEEIAGDNIMYANNALEITQLVIKLLNSNQPTIDHLKEKALLHAKKYSWAKTSTNILSQLEDN